MVVTLRRDPFRNGLPFDQNLLKILFASYFGVENIPSIYCNDQLLRLASPRHISTEDARNQPQTLIINSSADIVSDDGIIYGQILQNAGVACTVFTALGQVHDSAVLKATRNGPTARTIVRLVAAEIREAIESPKPALQHEAKATISTVDSNGTSH
jgi:acetyl esterase/lipase